MKFLLHKSNFREDRTNECRMFYIRHLTLSINHTACARKRTTKRNTVDLSSTWVFWHLKSHWNWRQRSTERTHCACE